MKNNQIIVKVIPINNREEFLVLDKFANEHWGEHSNDGDPELDFFDTPKYAIVAENSEDCIGELFIFPRETEFEGDKHRFIGIGGVVTHTNFRHQGIATKMLQEALRFAKSSGFEYAILCTDIERLGKLYERVGFEEMKNKYVFIDKNGIEKTEPGGMIAPLVSCEKVKTIQNSKTNFNVGISNF